MIQHTPRVIFLIGFSNDDEVCEMTTGSRRIEHALQGYDAYQAYVRDHPNGLEVNVIDKRAISRINAIPAHDDTVGVANIASISHSHRSRLDHVIEVINQEIQQKYLNEWLETQEQDPRFPERIIARNNFFRYGDSIAKNQVFIIEILEAMPVLNHETKVRNETEGSFGQASVELPKGCIIDFFGKYTDGVLDYSYWVLHKQAYEHFEELLQEERRQEIVEAFLGGEFTYEDYLDWIGGEDE